MKLYNHYEMQFNQYNVYNNFVCVCKSRNYILLTHTKHDAVYM